MTPGPLLLLLAWGAVLYAAGFWRGHGLGRRGAERDLAETLGVVGRRRS